MSDKSHEEIRAAVRESYGKVATQGGGCCSTSSCCTPSPAADVSMGLGYSSNEVSTVPDGANLGLGCGNPQAIAALRAGETVLDLGSGAGFDAFLAGRAVGDTGRVIGVDMTPEMLDKARSNAQKGGYSNVEFRSGQIEELPVADDCVDVIISNCVINLSPEKSRVFTEAFRVLKPGGRLAISDIVATADLPEEARKDLALYTGCMAGASSITELEQMMRDAGFIEIAIKPKDESREFIRTWAPGRGIEEYVVSATIEAIKPTNEVKNTMKQIKILGSGCRNCQATYDLISKTAAELGVAIQMEKVEDIGQIMGYGVMSTPGVVIDGKVVHSGSVPSRDTIAGWLSGTPAAPELKVISSCCSGGKCAG